MKKELTLAALLGAAALSADVICKGNFDGQSNGWCCYPYWGGKQTVDTAAGAAHSGKGALHLAATEAKGGVWARSICQPRIDYNVGKIYKFSFFAKGKGELYPGYQLAVFNRNGSMNYSHEFRKEPVKLTGEYQLVEWTFDFSARPADSLDPILELRGEGAEAWIDDLKFESVVTADTTIKPLNGLVELAVGSPLPELSFQTNRKNAKFQVFVISSKLPMLQQLVVQSDGDGKLVFRSDAVPAKPELYRVVVAADGMTAYNYVDIVDEATYVQLDAAAKAVKAGRPLSILYIGDSLADFHRGYNAVDKFTFFLNKYNKVSVDNRAVGGDYISRELQRMNYMLNKTGKPEYRQKAYDGIFDKKYDIIFIALGQNDTVTFSKDKFEKPAIAPAQVDKDYRAFIDILLAHNPGAKIVLVSGMRCDYERNLATAQKGHISWIFGTPKFSEEFNAVLQKIAAEKGYTYVDVYTPWSKLTPAERSPRFVDGVHLTNLGHRQLALELLKAMPAVLK